MLDEGDLEVGGEGIAIAILTDRCVGGVLDGNGLDFDERCDKDRDGTVGDDDAEIGMIPFQLVPLSASFMDDLVS